MCACLRACLAVCDLGGGSGRQIESSLLERGTMRPQPRSYLLFSSFFPFSCFLSIFSSLLFTCFRCMSLKISPFPLYICICRLSPFLHETVLFICLISVFSLYTLHVLIAGKDTLLLSILTATSLHWPCCSLGHWS